MNVSQVVSQGTEQGPTGVTLTLRDSGEYILHTMHLHICTCTYICTHTYTLSHLYTHKYTHTYTHTHTHTRTLYMHINTHNTCTVRTLYRNTQVLDICITQLQRYDHVGYLYAMYVGGKVVQETESIQGERYVYRHARILLFIGVGNLMLHTWLVTLTYSKSVVVMKWPCNCLTCAHLATFND